MLLPVLDSLAWVQQSLDLDSPEPTVASVVPREFARVIRVSVPPEGGPRALARVLSTHTETPERCFFALWAGYSDVEFPRTARTIRLALGREMVVYRNEVGAAARSVAHRPAERYPTLWWPQDRAWFVGSDVHAVCVFVGCSDEVAEELLADLNQPASEVTWETLLG